MSPGSGRGDGPKGGAGAGRAPARVTEVRAEQVPEQRTERGTDRVPDNDRVNDGRHVLVLPDRDAAEEVAQELADRFGVAEEPQLVRDALAGEDDAEDAQWLVVVEDPAARLDPAALDDFAAEYEGWLEAPR